MTHRQVVKGILVALAVIHAPAAAQAAVNLNKVNLALTGTPYESSSVDDYNSPYIAIDGVDGGDPNAYTATMTNADFHSWWQVDLGQSRHIGDLEIINRTDCCQDNIFPFAVIVADFPLIDTDITDEDGFTYPGVTRIIVSDAVEGKYVVPVHRTGQFVMIGLLKEYTSLSLGEVKVFEEYNAALGRSATQSVANGYIASTAANDNNTDGVNADGSVAVAKYNTIDKGAVYNFVLDNPTNVDTVDVWSDNTDCCATIFPRPTFTLIASPTFPGKPGAALPVGAAKITGIVQGAPATVTVGAKNIQYIQLILEAVDSFPVAEVQVWPVARGSVGGYPTISSKANNGTDPFTGIDFNLAASGNDILQNDVLTAVQTDPYYELDLGGDRYIESVKLWGLTESNSSTTFSVWASEFNKLPAGATVQQLRAGQFTSGAVEYPAVAAFPSTSVGIRQRARWLRITIEGANQQLGLHELEVFTTEGFVASPVNGAVQAHSLSTPPGTISGFHSRPNESIDVYAFLPNANTGAGFLNNWTYVGSGRSSATPTLSTGAIAPVYPWSVPHFSTLPAGTWAPGGVLGLYAQAYVNGDQLGVIPTPLRAIDQLVGGSLPTLEDPFWPHIRLPATDKSPDTNATPPQYLSKPMGTTLNTNYYNLFANGTYRELPPTLAQFNSRYLASHTTSANYYNDGDLGIGRKMTCANPTWVTPSGNASGTACAVGNYAPASPAGSKAPVLFGQETNSINLIKNGKPPFATVVMVKRQGQAGSVFGVYIPSTNPATTDPTKTKLIQTPAALDSTAFNASVPNNCMACHGGTAGSDPLNVSTAPSMLLPFDPSAVGKAGGSGYDWASQEENFRKLNAIISVAAAGPSTGITDFINGTYGGKVGTTGTKANPSYVPQAWQSSPGQKEAYTKVIKPYCRACHMSQTGLNFIKASDLDGLRALVLSDVCKAHVMPHSQRSMQKAWSSSARATLLSYFGRDDLDQTTMGLEACKP